MPELSFHELLGSRIEAVLEFITDQTPLVLSKDTSIHSALQALKEHRLRSCLLCDAPGVLHKSDTSICMFDMRGVVHSFVQTYKPETQIELKNFLRTFNQKKVKDLQLTTYKDIHFSDLSESVHILVSKFAVTSRVFICKDDCVLRCFGVMDFIELVRVAKCFEHLNDESRLYASLITTKAKDISGTRCLHTGVSRELNTHTNTNINTSTNITANINTNTQVISPKEKNGNINTQVIPSVGNEYHTHTLVALDDSNSLNDALRLFDSTQYSALPIVDVDAPSKCHGILSLRDLFTLFLHIDEISNDILTAPAIEYLTLVKRKMPKTLFPYVHTLEEAPFLYVISKIIASGIHRVLITNDADEITGIVSVTDIACFLVKEIQSTM